MPLPGAPGFKPKTRTSPLLNSLCPTMQDNKVVLPQPEAPNKPYLEGKRINQFIFIYGILLINGHVLD